MIDSIRQAYNARFTPEAYAAFRRDLDETYMLPISFRIAETPVFLPDNFRDRLLQASEDILATVTRPDFKALTAGAVPAQYDAANEDEHPTFICVDFAVCLDDTGALTPQLIELQGWPSLFCYQDWLASKYREHFSIPEDMTHLYGGLTPATYRQLLYEVIVGHHDPEQVILLEIDPEHQNTRIDFVCTEAMLGIKTVCISELEKDGPTLWYRKEGKKIPVRRIYNRLIFDDYERRQDKRGPFNLIDPVDVEWAGHPNWFFRLSKHTMPLLQSPYAPRAYYLDQLDEMPRDPENYVLKPLFSFSGQGVKFDVTRQELEAIQDKHNYILQRKVSYHPAIPTPEDPAKCEVRLMYIWPAGAPRPQLVTNLSRLSKGTMIGVRYNQDKTWVGGSVCFAHPV